MHVVGDPLLGSIRRNLSRPAARPRGESILQRNSPGRAAPDAPPTRQLARSYVHPTESDPTGRRCHSTMRGLVSFCMMTNGTERETGIFWRIVLVVAGFGVATLGWSLIMSVFLAFIGLPVFILGLALMQAQER